MPSARRIRVRREDRQTDWEEASQRVLELLRQAPDQDMALAMLSGLVADAQGPNGESLQEHLEIGSTPTIREWLREGLNVMQPYVRDPAQTGRQIADVARQRFMHWMTRGYDIARNEYNRYRQHQNERFAVFSRAQRMVEQLLAARQAPRRDSCINTNSFTSLERLESPYVQLPSGHCFDTEDVRFMTTRSPRNIGTNQDLTENERTCLEHFQAHHTVSETCRDTLILNPPLPPDDQAPQMPEV